MRWTAADIIARRRKLWDETHDLEQDNEFVASTADYMLEPKANLLRDEIKARPELLIEMTFTLVDKELETVPFFYNDVQAEFVADLRQAIEDRKSGRRNHIKILILKGRQQGFTTVITAFQLAHTIIRTNFPGMTIAHRDEATRTIFEEKAKFPYRNLPEALKPTELYNNRMEFHFEKLNSRWRIATAGSKYIGRSKMLTFFHGSEAASWNSIMLVKAGLGQALTKNAIEILETTAQGENEFKTLWDEAIKGRNNYEPKFYEWWRSSDYRLPYENEMLEFEHYRAVCEGIATEHFPDAEFNQKLLTLMDEHDLDWEQLYWYESKRQDLKGLLLQEYPCTAEEAFLMSGRPYFDRALCQRLLIAKMDIKPVEIRLGGSIVLFEKPDPKELYLAGADVAEGLADGDFSHAPFYRRSDFKQVAYIHGHFSPDRFGELLVEVGRQYNRAFLGIERNNHGHTVLNEVYKHQKYSEVYMQTVQDQKTDRKTKKLGWLTTETSKYLMLDELDKAVRTGEINPQDAELFAEMSTVTIAEDGSTTVTGKDRVVGHAIAWQMRKHGRAMGPVNP